ncbi:MAG: DUF5103 domain-containing protein [Bacteroidetes bacterium]|nr:DUF5103 domain-containing protein [Bacteroidota bacterium]
MLKSTVLLRLLSALLFLDTAAAAQVEIFGLRTFAAGDEYRPPVIAAGEQVTIEFDVATNIPPNLHILFYHSTRDWKVEQNSFINDPGTIRAEMLLYAPAPAAVYQYRYRYRNSFPNTRNRVAFRYSGNYIYRIVDADAADAVLAEGRFIVTENIIPLVVTMENRYHSEYEPPFNQRIWTSVAVDLPAEFTAADRASVAHEDVDRVAVIRNWELDRPVFIDTKDDDPESFVENLLRPNRTFIRRDVPVGNEYRRMDLSSVAFYPNNQPAVLRDGPDVSRFRWQGKPDANGATKADAFTGTNSDYLEVELRLRLAEPPAQKVYVTGGFSGWKVLPEYEMKPDTVSGLYVLRFWVRRGVYDYQYVLGTPAPDGTVQQQDWFTLEGNDWRTINRYTVLVYYADRRLGGVDRVIGSLRVRNAGTSDPGKKTGFPIQKIINNGPVYYTQPKN